jgi:glutaredoxin
MKRNVVTIYSRPGCHLCEEAKKVILSSDCGDLFEVEEVNIDLDAGLYEQYRYDIPVIFINGVKAFKHRVDPREFKRKLFRLKSGPVAD